MRSDCSGTLHPKAIEGLKLFNQKRFFEAHEELEDAWRNETGPIRELYRGILQAAVVYLHITRGNYNGAVKVHERCVKWLNHWPDICRGVQVGKLKQDLEGVMKAVKELGGDKINEFDTSLFGKIEWSEKRIWICDRCGAEMNEKNCKVSCPNCGNRFDCSDLNIYFD
jgi:predicted metal-dependent hydrolase